MCFERSLRCLEDRPDAAEKLVPPHRRSSSKNSRIVVAVRVLQESDDRQLSSAPKTDFVGGCHGSGPGNPRLLPDTPADGGLASMMRLPAECTEEALTEPREHALLPATESAPATEWTEEERTLLCLDRCEQLLPAAEGGRGRAAEAELWRSFTSATAGGT
mmetsp:Transcript_65561/g.137050  ORF Transcript_65561/g.137050 Transcript_65561/m.137050 type:complete len:161 (+) Transcript_65561:331-813(+)